MIKKHGGRVGVVKLEDGRPANLNISDLDSAWNNTYYRSVRQMMLAGEKPKLLISVTKKRRLDIEVNAKWETEYWLNNGVNLDELLEQTYEDGSTTSKLRYIDIRMGTKC